MSEIDIKTLFEAGAHFGHKTSRWHPKMAPYIHSKRGGIHIIDLETTAEKLAEAMKFVESTVVGGKQILFVGTKRQASQIIGEAASDVEMPYVNLRWFGGLLTNYKTINERVKHLKKLEERMDSGELANRYNKLEVQRFQEEIDQMNQAFGGIKEMNGLPGAVFVIDILDESIAVKEANKLGIPVIAVVDTNGNPDLIDYPIPANDDAIKTIGLITNYIVEAINNGKGKHKKLKAAAIKLSKKNDEKSNKPTTTKPDKPSTKKEK